MKDYYKNLNERDKKLFTILWLHLLVKPMTLKEMSAFFKENKIPGASDLHLNNKLSVLLHKMLKQGWLSMLDSNNPKKIAARANGRPHYTGRWDINTDVIIFEDIMKERIFPLQNYKEIIKDSVKKIVTIIRKVYDEPVYIHLIKKLESYDYTTLLSVVNYFLSCIFAIKKTVMDIAENEFIEGRVVGKTIYEEYTDNITDPETYKYFQKHITELNLKYIKTDEVLNQIIQYFKKLNEIKNEKSHKIIKLEKAPDSVGYMTPKDYTRSYGNDKLITEWNRTDIPSNLDKFVLCYSVIIVKYQSQKNGIELPEKMPDIFSMI